MVIYLSLLLLVLDLRGEEEGKNKIINSKIQRDLSPIFLTMKENFSRENNFKETIEIQKFVLDISTLNIRNFTGSVKFVSFEKVEFKTGVFKNKGFFLSEFTIRVENESYSCLWKGMCYRKNDKIYTKGVVTGGSYGKMEGVFSQKSGVYVSTLSVSHIGKYILPNTIRLGGDYSIKETKKYENCKIHYLQKGMKGEINKFYGEKLDMSLTYLRINEVKNLYNNKGFTIIFFSSNAGEGIGYAYGERTKGLITEFQGVFSSPLESFFMGRLDETLSPSVFELSITSFNWKEKTEPKLELDIWAPESSDSYQMITYVVRVRNIGLKEARKVTTYVDIPPQYNFILASGEYWNLFTHYDVPPSPYEIPDWVRWDEEVIPPRSFVIYIFQVEPSKDLSVGSKIRCKGSVYMKR